MMFSDLLQSNDFHAGVLSMAFFVAVFMLVIGALA
jgi:hypothetical protein